MLLRGPCLNSCRVVELTVLRKIFDPLLYEDFQKGNFSRLNGAAFSERAGYPQTKPIILKHLSSCAIYIRGSYRRLS